MSASAFTAPKQGQVPPDNLFYVFVISRHGQRTPVMRCRNLPKNEPVDYGQLTAKGREQTFRLGQFLRDRYKVFMGASDKPGQVLATHVGLDRCRDSVRETLRGLGVPAATPIADPTRYGVPFLGSVNDNMDKVLKEPGRGDFSTLGDLVAFVAEKTGAPWQNNGDKFLVMDSLVTHVLNGNPVPDWAKSMWDDLLWADRRVFVRSLVGYERPFAGYVLGRVLDTLTIKFEKRVERPDKMHVFSMSDTSVFSVLKLLDSSHDGRPCFCASILIEVYKDGHKDCVRILYRTQEEPCLVPMNKTENPCELSKFLGFLRGVLKTP
ncbi:testicular acid phosphatase-like [Dermacentor silvarum]|uniref:testicular acid phosphatase-like n=1 Tax=Dermacentor silvarum TaxID=543639 RepID=UPI00189C27A0|nr:testicular acid phosphatase-like [Dermacentor silvarum]